MTKGPCAPERQELPLQFDIIIWSFFASLQEYQISHYSVLDRMTYRAIFVFQVGLIVLFAIGVLWVFLPVPVTSANGLGYAVQCS